MIFIITAIITAYLVGSIPTAYIFGKLLKGVDIRDFGSGNVGATNAFRTLGKGIGLTVFVIDFLKGFLAVVILGGLLKNVVTEPTEFLSFNVGILLGTAAIAGHIWTVFLNFKGGKGVATSAGVMAALSAPIVLCALTLWIIVFAISRFVSLASIAASFALPVFAIIFGKDISFIFFSAVLCIIGVWGHRSNIKRLLEGTEKKLV